MAKQTKFGAFFRQRRRVMGLSLREFCRRAGVDPGNISRLERGLAPPPESPSILASYARALQLREGSHDWDRFFILAAAEAGRLPADLLEDPRAAAELPRVLQQLRQGSGHRNWVDALALEQWAETWAARHLLPQLVRRLVHATGSGLEFVDFPAGEMVTLPGFDGLVYAAQASPFVPQGRSVWELSTESLPLRKAAADLAKRTRQRLPFDKHEATFIFVTPRRVPNKRDWENKHREDGVWKEVYLYDSSSLEQWLETAPAVDVWLAKQLGLRPEGLSEVESYWQILQQVTYPALAPDVFLASRHKQQAELLQWLCGPPDMLLVEYRSPLEALDFVVAAVTSGARHLARTPCAPAEAEVQASLAAQQHDAGRQVRVVRLDVAQPMGVLPALPLAAILARALIVETREAWLDIVRCGTPLVLVAHPRLELTDEMLAAAARAHCHLIQFVLPGPVRKGRILALPRPARHDLQESLLASGLERTRASDVARNCGGSVTVLKRVLGRNPAQVPAWATQPPPRELSPLLLAGAWSEQCPADRKALAALAGMPYDEWLAAITRLQTADDLLLRTGDVWRLVSRDDSWDQLAHAVSQDQFERFEQIAAQVLEADDPAYELPPDQWLIAPLVGKEPAYSGWLRTGLAETLALAGARGGHLRNVRGVSQRACRIVRQLLERKDWKRWASLSPQLALLAEAAPDTFLDALESSVKSGEASLETLFKRPGLFGPCLHIGLLSALEVLAWDVNYVTRACRALLDLALLAEGKPVSPSDQPQARNAPLDSLVEVFKPWHPQTNASVRQRIEVLHAMAARSTSEPTRRLVRRLLLRLLPRETDSAQYNRRPAFRDFALSVSEEVTQVEIDQQAAACGKLLIDLVGTDASCWAELVEHLDWLPHESQQRLVQELQRLQTSLHEQDTACRQEFADALRARLIRIRSLCEARGAPLPSVVGQLDEVVKQLEPEDCIGRHAWLFDQWWKVRLPTSEQAQREVERLRYAALEEIRAKLGWNGVLQLAGAVKAPDELGAAVAGQAVPGDDGRVLPGFLRTKHDFRRRFARGYVEARCQAGGWDWVDRLSLRRWSQTEVAEFALCLPFEQRAWEFAARKGPEAERSYWQRTESLYTGDDPRQLRLAVTQLVKHKRPFHACTTLALALNRLEVETDLLFAVLDAARGGKHAEPHEGFVHHGASFVSLLVQQLHARAKHGDAACNSERLAMVEWSFLELLDSHNVRPTALHAELARNEKLFVELLKLVYPPQPERQQAPPALSKADADRAENAYRLLCSWQTIPGSCPDGTVEGQALLSWLEEARTLARAAGLLNVCDRHVGEVFAQAPPEADGTWPCVAVRDAIEELESRDLETAFQIAVYNRGGLKGGLVHGRSNEAGKGDRFLAWADACRIFWPRTARCLRHIAELYQQDTRHREAFLEVRW
ncbi:MAG: helix-turn-helix domain-containing protein [Pirellulales bacterium]|nr:helix-turn-helix domain-containing protein [Pirellulales bacterium]